eukprot:CAMPEP_0116022408 /NCGR_PEP_ID=MMETSP0321-20121206/10970_1 /TAXON_ID=163516 /ORGANISM="Leptocylindrus danicus var. danicus, Strain B650" /LENGTH=114 /DNA_ID=CAMNT_0003493475 /DNA_START=29 /DNA_END=369 /DNA_ORIENTATION=-
MIILPKLYLIWSGEVIVVSKLVSPSSRTSSICAISDVERFTHDAPDDPPALTCRVSPEKPHLGVQNVDLNSIAKESSSDKEPEKEPRRIAEASQIPLIIRKSKPPPRRLEVEMA